MVLSRWRSVVVSTFHSIQYRTYVRSPPPSRIPLPHKPLKPWHTQARPITARVASTEQRRKPRADCSTAAASASLQSPALAAPPPPPRMCARRRAPSRLATRTSARRAGALARAFGMRQPVSLGTVADRASRHRRERRVSGLRQPTSAMSRSAFAPSAKATIQSARLRIARVLQTSRAWSLRARRACTLVARCERE